MTGGVRPYLYDAHRGSKSTPAATSSPVFASAPIKPERRCKLRCPGQAHHADPSRRMDSAHRPDVRHTRPKIRLRLGHVVAEDRRARDRGGRPSAHRRRPANPRSPRRQPRHRWARIAPFGESRRDDRIGRKTTRKWHARAHPLGRHAARCAEATIDRDHSDAVPPTAGWRPPKTADSASASPH